MILVLQKNTPEPAIRQLMAQLALQNVKGGCVAGETSILLPLVGETWRLDPAALQALPYVQEARRLTPAYHLAARSTHPENTVVPVGDVRVGADFCLIAGPCAVESAHQIQTVAAAVKAAGAVMLRGGAFKPRTSPYTFQGLGEQGAALLVQAGRDTGLPTVTEITDWSWRYTNKDYVKSADITPTKPDDVYTFNFANTRSITKWLGGDAYSKNVFGTIIETDSGN